MPIRIAVYNGNALKIGLFGADCSPGLPGLLKLFEQAAEARHFVQNSVPAQRVPIGRRVDGDDRLAEPQFGGSGEPHHAEIGADLDDRVDVAAVAVELDQLVAQQLGRDLGDRGPAPARQINVAHHPRNRTR